MRHLTLAGLDKPVSQLVLGCDNKLSADDGAGLWSAFVAAGGTAFDTAHIYGKGQCERALGDWLHREGPAREAVVIVKGAHAPWCNPESLVAQLHESLERLRLPKADIYLMHRDNPAVPAGEFVDALDGLAEAGLIGIYGGSNWTVARMRAANAYAGRTGRRPMRALSNNLSLARMVKPVWEGCISASDAATRAFLTETGTAHFAWSSQARGYFHPAGQAAALPDGTRPDECFDSPENRERRRRAGALGERVGATAAQVATAWVLSQPFRSFALIGPRTVAELAQTLAGPELVLDAETAAWLDLERDEAPANLRL